MLFSMDRHRTDFLVQKNHIQIIQIIQTTPTDSWVLAKEIIVGTYQIGTGQWCQLEGVQCAQRFRFCWHADHQPHQLGISQFVSLPHWSGHWLLSHPRLASLQLQQKMYDAACQHQKEKCAQADVLLLLSLRNHRQTHHPVWLLHAVTSCVFKWTCGLGNSNSLARCLFFSTRNTTTKEILQKRIMKEKKKTLIPASSPAISSTSVTWKPRLCAHIRYMRITIAAQSMLSVPPAPACTWYMHNPPFPIHSPNPYTMDLPQGPSQYKMPRYQ